MIYKTMSLILSFILLTCALTPSISQTTCRGRCGIEYYRGYLCQCDYGCMAYGECCLDFEAQCTTKNSCRGRCGETFKRGQVCSCDSDCVKYKQCCPDYKIHCDEEDQTPPPLTDIEGTDEDNYEVPPVTPTSNPQDDPNNDVPTEATPDDGFSNTEAPGEHQTPPESGDVTTPEAVTLVSSTAATPSENKATEVKSRTIDVPEEVTSTEGADVNDATTLPDTGATSPQATAPVEQASTQPTTTLENQPEPTRTSLAQTVGPTEGASEKTDVTPSFSATTSEPSPDSTTSVATPDPSKDSSTSSVPPEPSQDSSASPTPQEPPEESSTAVPPEPSQDSSASSVSTEPPTTPVPAEPSQDSSASPTPQEPPQESSTPVPPEPSQDSSTSSVPPEVPQESSTTPVPPEASQDSSASPTPEEPPQESSTPVPPEPSQDSSESSVSTEPPTTPVPPEPSQDSSESSVSTEPPTTPVPPEPSQDSSASPTPQEPPQEPEQDSSKSLVYTEPPEESSTTPVPPEPSQDSSASPTPEPSQEPTTTPVPTEASPDVSTNSAPQEPTPESPDAVSTSVPSEPTTESSRDAESSDATVPDLTTTVPPSIQTTLSPTDPSSPLDLQNPTTTVSPVVPDLDAITTVGPLATGAPQGDSTTVDPLESTQKPTSPESSEPTPKPEHKPNSSNSQKSTAPVDKPTPKPGTLDDSMNYQGDDSNDTNLCSGRPASAITTLRNGTIAVFRGHYFWFLDQNRVPGPARGITQTWGVPSPIDTVFTRCNCHGKTYIMKGNQYWRFENDHLDQGYPKAVETGFDGLRGHVTAALSVPEYRRRTESVYFFKRGGLVQKYSYRPGSSSSCNKKPQFAIYTVRRRVVRQAASLLGPTINIRMSWRGFPTTVTSAVSVPTNREPEGYKYYVFSRSKSYNIRMDTDRPVITSPRGNPSSQNNFIKCPKTL
uniref:proteoglycan 4b isoform X2 n=1 Tax=Doryrhamphus excisus TaxID=161450 RepID=UPI0025AE1C18|nr:proteoglycan 4b isoform X2 [Doryrhamphus excisus]